MNTENKTPAGTTVFRNWISFIGLVVAGGSLFAFLLLFVLDALAKFSNPYVSLLTYIGVPGFLISGLFLLFLGAWLERAAAPRAPVRPICGWIWPTRATAAC